MVAPTRAPERVGRYELLLPIGTGGMATVYLARAGVVGDVHRDVALKLMHPHLSAESGDAASVLMEEAKLAARIRHPNVVSILEAGEDEGRVFLAMDYVEGDTLAALIRNEADAGHRIPLPIVGRILCDALAGLHAAHELCDEHGRLLNVVHRDYSPSNILVSVDGTTKLADFGVAKAEGRASGTTTGVIKGKVGYMAPEQVLGHALDRRCDIWAAGVVAWECIAGRRMYRDDDQVATLLRIVREPPPSLNHVRPDVSEAVLRVIGEALALLERRCATAEELRRRFTDAWRTTSELADPADVGRYVSERVRGKIEQRRSKVADVVRLRAELNSVSREAIALADDDTSIPAAPAPTFDALGSATEVTAALDETSTILRPPHRGVSLGGLFRSRVGVVSALVAATLLFVGTWAITRRDAGASLGGATPEASASSAVSAPERSSAEAPAPTALAPLREALHVTSDVPLTALQIGSRVVAIVEPTKEIEVRLSAQEAGSGVVLQAVTSDGRRQTVDVAPDQPDVTLVFAGIALKSTGVARRAPPPPRAATPSSTKRAPGLAPPPYGGGP